MAAAAFLPYRGLRISRVTITVGLGELEAEAVAESVPLPQDECAVWVGGRKKLAQTDPTLLADLELLIDPVTRGDPESPLRWTCKSLRKLADELRRQGHQSQSRCRGRVAQSARLQPAGQRQDA